ncbi:NADH-quinone oxidoreductase subunit L [uncultured Hydrogenophaga sp.]|uniref:NADH-quinone oxidoreductase subunit L n=1 Tax=uncultured Hydrogenophaga sp. TaxID=199683 RepID=UPI00265F50D8|nr:NADH-quinone oxidoreductase subunit L [uncultured Hydrogenophaga sp.]
MNPTDTLLTTFMPAVAVAPALLMLLAMLLPMRQRSGDPLTPHTGWTLLRRLGLLAVAFSAVPVVLQVAGLARPEHTEALSPWLASTPWAAWMALLVQWLGTVIAAFSARYLQGERRQGRYVSALAGVLASVHTLLLADHWWVLIAAWALVGMALQQLLVFYPERPFALLAAHKKRLADRLADLLLLLAAGLAWSAVGSGHLPDLWAHLAQHGAGPALQASAVCLALAVVLRTALLPVHGWLIQVMEAPTPVSALLHAGVVNLGGFVLIRFSPLLDAAPLARWLLVAVGLTTALLAGLVMLTRISVKVRLAWSTVAQMGFMVMECGLGLYTLAALHLLGHSLYKAHAFLSASSVVRDARLQRLNMPHEGVHGWSLLVAPVLAVAVLAGVLGSIGQLAPLVSGGAAVPAAWPWWWSGVLALAWAPLLWLPRVTLNGPQASAGIWRLAAGVLSIAGLSALAFLAHLLPLGTYDRPDAVLGLVALLGMGLMYLALAGLQWRARWLEGWRRWSYAGFYIDEFYTRLTLRLWPTDWAPPRSGPLVPAGSGSDLR